MIAWQNRNVSSAAVTEKRVLWERREPLRKSEAQRPQIHPDQDAEQSVLEMQSFSELLSPKLDLGSGVIGLRDLQSTGMAFEMTPLASEAPGSETGRIDSRENSSGALQHLPAASAEPVARPGFRI